MTIQDIFRLYRTEAVEGADGGGGSGGADDKGAGGDKGGDTGAQQPTGLLGAADAAAKAAAAAEAAKNSGKPARPENVPEQFWDAEKGAVKQDAILKSWQDTRNELKAAKSAKGGAAPEKPDGYKFTMPAGSDGKPVPVEIGENDPAMSLAKVAAHKANLTQEQYDIFMQTFVSGAAQHMPPPVDLEAEKAKLGPNADAVMTTTIAWVDGFVTTGTLSKDERDELVFMGSTALGIRALNKIRESTGEKQIPLEGAVQEGLPSKAELYARVGDPRYQSDDAFRQETDKLFEKVYGTQPAGTSERGMGVGVGQGAHSIGKK